MEPYDSVHPDRLPLQKGNANKETLRTKITLSDTGFKEFLRFYVRFSLV